MEEGGPPGGALGAPCSAVVFSRFVPDESSEGGGLLVTPPAVPP